MRARAALVLAVLPLLASCAATGSVTGVLIPRGPADKSLDEAVVYMEPTDASLKESLSSWGDRVTVTFAKETMEPAVSVAVVGTWLEIWNEDHVFHQPFSRSAAAPIAIRSVRPQSGTAVQLRTKGLVHIFCQLHASESAEILVLDSGVWTRPDTNGAFSFTRLPRGRYMIHAWHPRLGQQKVPLEIEKSGPMSVELRY